MNQLNSINTISSLLSRFVVEVKGLNAINQYGINFLSETVLIPLFTEIFEYQNLVNLNTEANNFPGIDIADRIERVAFQITSNADNDKIKHTLKQFVDYEHYKDFDTLIIYCISEKVKIDKDYTSVINDKFVFSSTENILDYKDLLKRINSITDFEKILKIEKLLAQQFSEIKLAAYKETIQSPLNEISFSNLLKIDFPSKLYAANLNITKKDLQNKKSRIFNDRELIFQYKKENGLHFSADWIDHNKQIYTFHDLSNQNHDLSSIIDLATVEIIATEDFYTESKDHERAFKALLKFCFSKYAYYLDIEFRHKENLFIFKSKDENSITRRETWNSGKRNASRDVVKVKQHKADKKIWYFTHLAFSIAFKLYNYQWYLEITPDWYITKDGANKHYGMDKSVTSWLKKQERNMHVFNNIKFIANFLKYTGKQTNLFEDEGGRRPKNFIDFSNFEAFKNSPHLKEDDWKIRESQEIIDIMTDKEGNIDSDL